LHLEQANTDFFILCELLSGSVRDAFHERTKLVKSVINGYFEQWEAKAERGQENLAKISKIIKMEAERFEKCRIRDFKMMFIKYLENHLNNQALVCRSIKKQNMRITVVFQLVKPSCPKLKRLPD
jgi:hypothetical protein